MAAAMFVFVIDTSFMNVSISAVVEDLDTTVSGVQSAVAIEALVSAAFILISSKIGDLFGRKRAFVLGMLFYAVGALAMVFAQGLTAIIVFWAVIGGIGASLLLPAMQSLIHGNFEGAAQKKVYALVGAAAAIAAAVGPLLGGFITTFLSWRVGFALEVVIIIAILAGIRLVLDVPYTGPRHIDVVQRPECHARRSARLETAEQGSGIDHAVREAPLVVVPAHHARQRPVHDRGLGRIEAARRGGVVEVDADELVRVVIHDTAQLALGRRLHRAVDRVLRRLLLEVHVE